MRAVPVQSTEATLGEGLHWDEHLGLLYWVDIHGKRFFRWDLSSSPEVIQLDQRIGWVLPSHQEGQLVFGLQSGIAVASASNPVDYQMVHTLYPDRPEMRLNDAKMDSHGRIWAGSLNNDDESQPVGELFRIDIAKRVDVVDTGYCVPNGPAISPCETQLMHTDSAQRKIYCFDLDVKTGVLSNKRLWLEFREQEGYPDGMNFDSNGFLWVAHWGGGCISQYDMNRKLRSRINIPVTNVTNVCFAGPAQERMFVTTAKEAANPGEQFSGYLFEVFDFN